MTILVETSKVECSCEGLYAVESPMFTVVDWVGGDEVWKKTLVRTLDPAPRYLIQSGPRAFNDSSAISGDDVSVSWIDCLCSFWSASCINQDIDDGLVTHDKTIPRNRCPTFMSRIRPCRESFLPEHLRGSQWLKSHMATGTPTFAVTSSIFSSLLLLIPEGATSMAESGLSPSSKTLYS